MIEYLKNIKNMDNSQFEQYKQYIDYIVFECFEVCAKIMLTHIILWQTVSFIYDGKLF